MSADITTPANIHRSPASKQDGNGFKRDGDPEVRRAPDDADREERKMGKAHARDPCVSSFGIEMRGSSFTVSRTIVVRVDVTLTVDAICWRRI